MSNTPTWRVRYETDIYVTTERQETAEVIALDHLIAANKIKDPKISTTTGIHRYTDKVVMPDEPATDV